MDRDFDTLADALDLDEPTAADLAADEAEALASLDADAWIEAMLAADDDQAAPDLDDPFGLGDDPFADDEREKTEDELWGDDSEDHAYSFPVQTVRIPTQFSAPLVSASDAEKREALREWGFEVGTRGRLSAALLAEYAARAV